MSRLGLVLLCGMVSSFSLLGCEMRTKPARPTAASTGESAPVNATSQPDGGAGSPAAGAAKTQPTSQPAPSVASGGERWSGGGVSWVVPAGWEQKPGGGMRAATLVVEGLEITARTSGNAIVEDAIMSTRRSVEEGKTIAEPLKGTDVFPSMVVQMVAVGEQTGALETMLSKIADFYEDEVDEATANMLALMEPIMISFLGVVIGGIVISMYMPMFDLITKIG